MVILACCRAQVSRDSERTGEGFHVYSRLEIHQCHVLWVSPYHPLSLTLPSTQRSNLYLRVFSMTSLIEGWFQPENARPFVDTSTDPTATSPRKSKPYLSVYDSYAALGSISTGVFVGCDLRLYLAGQAIIGKVVHVHGRFSVIAPAGEGEPRLQVEVHRFVVMNAMDPASEDIPGDLCTSVTLSGRVILLADATGNSADKFFTLEVSEYVRDRAQTFNIRFAASTLSLRQLLTDFCRCRLNRTTSKRWENTTGPAHGSTVLISGYLGGETAGALRVEVETMQFISPSRGGKGIGSPPTPGRSRFGIPIGYGYHQSNVFLLLTVLRQA